MNELFNKIVNDNPDIKYLLGNQKNTENIERLKSKLIKILDSFEYIDKYEIDIPLCEFVHYKEHVRIETYVKIIPKDSDLLNFEIEERTLNGL